MAPHAVMFILTNMVKDKAIKLRRGWTTGACATAAVKAALIGLWSKDFPKSIEIFLPNGESPSFPLLNPKSGCDWTEVGIEKDAGDDPDVTHGCTVVARVSESESGILFKAGSGVGTVTMAGLPVGVGEPAINPKPREMMAEVVYELSKIYNKKPNIKIVLSIPNGEIIAKKTWNPRLGIINGLSILGTTGIVRPFSCAAWIASIHRGIDVAREAKASHVAGCTGSTSERAVQKLYELPDYAMLDMGDFVGGMIKYLNTHPLPYVTIGGGIGKMTKFAFGAVDLHSKRSQVNFNWLSDVCKKANLPDVSSAKTALDALEIAGNGLAELIAKMALIRLKELIKHPTTKCGIVIVNRNGKVLAEEKK